MCSAGLNPSPRYYVASSFLNSIMAHFIYNILVEPERYGAVHTKSHCDVPGKPKIVDYQWEIIYISQDQFKTKL